MDAKIRVNVEELIGRLNNLLEDDYAVAELTFNPEIIEEDSSISISAVDPMSNQVVDYGEIPFDDGEI